MAQGTQGITSSNRSFVPVCSLVKLFPATLLTPPITMVAKKKKPPKEPDYSKKPVLPNKFAEFVQAKYGLTPDELHKLFESVGRVNPLITVARRRKIEGKEHSKIIGKTMSMEEAVGYEKERAESRFTKEEKIRQELLDDVDFDELMVRLEVNDAFYPKKLAPSDIANYVGSAGEKLDALDLERTKKPRIYSPREETILDVITLIKKQEPIRVAKHIADRQRAYILAHSLEELETEYAEWLRNLRGDPPPETEEEMMARLAEEEAVRIEEERIAAEEAARNFGDLEDVHTLLDDAAALIKENPDAAAAIIRQWLGNVILAE